MSKNTLEETSFTTTATSKQETVPRRDALTKLLGGLGAMALLGCSEGSGDTPAALDRKSLELLGADGTLKVAANIGELRAITGGTPGWIAILLGYWRSGDGGGGVFYWDSAGAADDGGTVINAGGIGQWAAGWRRVIDGPVVTAKQFGGTGNDPAQDDAQGIGRALAYLTGIDGGGTLLLPPAAYYIKTPITIPNWYSRPVRIIGSGRVATSLRGTGLSASTPVLAFDGPHQAGYNVATGFHLEGMVVARDNVGPVFEYAPSHINAAWTDGVQYCLEYATFRSLTFAAPLGGTAPAVTIENAGNSRFEDITVEGGVTALRIVRARRATMDNVRYPRDRASTNGIELEACNMMSIRNVRIEAANGGFGFKLQGCSDISVEDLGFEGSKSPDGYGFSRKTHPQIWVNDSTLVEFENAATGSRANTNQSPQYGIHVSGLSSAVAFRGGILYGSQSIVAGSHSLVIDGTVRDVVCEDVAMFMWDGTDGNVGTEIVLGPGAADIRLGLMFSGVGPNGGSQSKNRYVVKSPAPVVAPVMGVLSARAADEITVSGTSTITSLAGGYSGQRLTLFFQGAGCQIVAGATIRLATSSFTSNVGSVLMLVFDGTSANPHWTETGRVQ